MFSIFNKHPLHAQFKEYLKILDGLGEEKSLKLYEHVRDNEDRFPTIRQLRIIIRSIGLFKQRSFDKTYDDCYYCGGIGYVPYLISPEKDKRAVNYLTVMYACQCTARIDLLQRVPRYFTIFKKAQFESDGEHNYPQIVQNKQYEFNRILRDRIG